MLRGSFAPSLRHHVNSWPRDENMRSDFARFQSVLSASQLSRRSVAVSVLTTSFDSGRCLFLSERCARRLRPLPEPATPVWSEQVTSFSAWQRCRRVKSDFIISEDEDTFDAREQRIGNIRCWLWVHKGDASTEDDISLQVGDETRPVAVFLRRATFLP